MKNKALILSLLMLPLLVSVASACSCIYLENTEQKLENAEYVFLGKIEDIKISGSQYNEIQEMTVKTISYWKPSEFPESVNLKIYANKDSGANCGYNFEEGKEYVIYAYLDTETGQLSTNSCMGNSLSNIAINEISELDDLTNSTTTINEENEIEEEKEENIVSRFFSWIKNLFS